MKHCTICNLNYTCYATYYRHLQSKKHIRTANRTNLLKLNRTDMKILNIKLILNELLEPETIDMEYIKDKIKQALNEFN